MCFVGENTEIRTGKSFLLTDNKTSWKTRLETVEKLCYRQDDRINNITNTFNDYNLGKCLEALSH